MKNNITEIVFILDRSGSMCGLEKDTIGGFNSFIEKQKQEEGEAFVTTVLFDHEFEYLHNRVNIQNIESMTSKQYYVRGCTALLDSIGQSITNMKTIQDALPKELKAEKVLFVITTDGYENASQHYTYKKVNKLISTQKEKYNWEFLFLGANIDAIDEASKLGIHADNAVNYYHDGEGIASVYKAVDEFTQNLRSSSPKKHMNWKESVEKDYKRKR